MDSKIILAVLIVALIGIVAATYQGETSNVMNSLANVATEDSNAADSVTDLAQASSEGSGSVKVDESIVQPDSSVNSKVDTTPKTSSNNQQSQTTTSSSSSSNTGNTGSNSGSNSNSNTGNNGNTERTSNTPTSSNTQQQNSSTNNNQNSPSQQPGISEAQAMSIAKNSLPDGITSDFQKVSETTIDGKTYYEVNLYKDGEIIAYSEIDSSNGKVTGGAMKDEAPRV